MSGVRDDLLAGGEGGRLQLLECELVAGGRSDHVELVGHVAEVAGVAAEPAGVRLETAGVGVVVRVEDDFAVTVVFEEPGDGIRHGEIDEVRVVPVLDGSVDDQLEDRAALDVVLSGDRERDRGFRVEADRASVEVELAVGRDRILIDTQRELHGAPGGIDVAVAVEDEVVGSALEVAVLIELAHEERAAVELEAAEVVDRKVSVAADSSASTGQSEGHGVLVGVSDLEGAVVDVDLAGDRGVAVGVEDAFRDRQVAVEFDRVQIRVVVHAGVDDRGALEGHGSVEAEAAVDIDETSADGGFAAESGVVAHVERAAGNDLQDAAVREGAVDVDQAAVDDGSVVGEAVAGVGDVDVAVVDQAGTGVDVQVLDDDVVDFAGIVALDQKGRGSVEQEFLAAELAVASDHHGGIAVEGHVVGFNHTTAGFVPDGGGLAVHVEAEVLEILVFEIDGPDQHGAPTVEVDVAAAVAATTVFGGVQGCTVGDLQDPAPLATCVLAATCVVHAHSAAEPVVGPAGKHQAGRLVHGECPFGGIFLAVLAGASATDASGQECEAVACEGDGLVTEAATGGGIV